MTASSPAPVRMFYVDDSGAPQFGWIVYSWIEVTLPEWRNGLRAWIDLRKAMFAAHKIPPSYELHSTNFLNGRGHPSLDPAWNDSKEARRNLVEQALTVIGTTPQMSVGTVYRHTAARRRDYNRERGEVYARLVAELDARLGRVGEHGLIFMDGAGTDPAYYAAHRALKLAHRNVIEDPLFQHSHRSQWVQMADIAAYTAYQGLIRVPAKQFAWDWYTDHLGPIDVNGGPMAL